MPPQQRRGEIGSHSDVFNLDLHKALVEQLPLALNRLSTAPLAAEQLDSLGNERGVYQLFERGQSVYVGKSEEPLAERLEQHRRRCSGRLNIDVNDMTFRCLYVDQFVDAVTPERILIDIYKAENLAPWNISEGFGAKDVGRNRDNGVPGRWFLDRPADYRSPVSAPSGGRSVPLIHALETLKEAVPFDLFRFASRRSRNPKDREDARRDYPGRSVVLPDDTVPILNHMLAIMEQLPPGWQTTVLPQGVIMYKESIAYAYAFDGWQRVESGVRSLPQGRAYQLAAPTLLGARHQCDATGSSQP